MVAMVLFVSRPHLFIGLKIANRLLAFPGDFLWDGEIKETSSDLRLDFDKWRFSLRPLTNGRINQTTEATTIISMTRTASGSNVCIADF